MFDRVYREHGVKRIIRERQVIGIADENRVAHLTGMRNDGLIDIDPVRRTAEPTDLIEQKTPVASYFKHRVILRGTVVLAYVLDM